jgi:hypothetical protein
MCVHDRSAAALTGNLTSGGHERARRSVADCRLVNSLSPQCIDHGLRLFRVACTELGRTRALSSPAPILAQGLSLGSRVARTNRLRSRAVEPSTRPSASRSCSTARSPSLESGRERSFCQRHYQEELAENFTMHSWLRPRRLVGAHRGPRPRGQVRGEVDECTGHAAVGAPRNLRL